MKKILIMNIAAIFLLSNYCIADSGHLKRRGSDDRGSDDRGSDDRGSDDRRPSSSTQLILVGSNVKLTLGNDRVGPKVKIERRQKQKRSIVSEDQFETAVKLPVPSQGLGINTTQDASSSDVILTLSRQNANYAICTLDMDNIKRTRFGLRAEYKVKSEIKLKKSIPVIKFKKGACDLDLNSNGVQAGLPNVLRGDSFLIEVNDIALFSGSF